MAELEIKEPKPVIAKVSEIEGKALEIKEKRALPIAPGKLVGFKDLQEWLKLLTVDEQRERVTIWVYRRDPIINRQIVDPQNDNNIDIIFSGFGKLTEEYMRENHGGGNYKFTIKDADKPKTQMGGFFEAVLDIPMIDCPPKLDLREVEWDNIKNKGFRSWCRARKLIDENNMPIVARQDNGAAPSGDAMVQAMKLAMDFASKMDDKQQAQLKRQLGAEDTLGKSIGDILLEKMKQDDPNKQLGTLTTLIAAMQKMQPEVKPDNTLGSIMPIFTMMITQMQESSKQALESSKQQFQLMLEMIKGQNQAKEGGEGGSEIEKLRAIIELSKEIKGGGVAHEKSTAEVVTDFLAPVIGPALSIVGNIVAMNAQARGVKAVATASQANQPSNAVEAMNRENQNMTQNQPQGQNTLPSPSEPASIIASYGPLIINKLEGPGWEFGAAISDLFGGPAAAAIVKYGSEELLKAAKSVPQFWQQVEGTYGEAHLKKWLESLCNYREIMSQMEEEEEIEGDKPDLPSLPHLPSKTP